MPDRSKRSTTHARAKPRLPRATAEHAPDTALLRLARTIADVRAADGPGRLQAALEQLAAAYGHDTEVPALLFETWLERRRHGRLDKTRALAVAWAREQVRLALQELLEEESARGRIRADVTAESLAWMLLVGCEALAHEPPGSAPDKVRLLLALADGGERC